MMKFLLLLATAFLFGVSTAFTIPSSNNVNFAVKQLGGVPYKRSNDANSNIHNCLIVLSAESKPDNSDGVVELADDDDDEDGTTVGNNGASSTESSSSSERESDQVVAPFLSQGDIAPEAMEMDWSDPKQTRVMIYIILSLLPVLFLIPLMLASRDLIPMEMLPPVEIQ